MRERDTQAGYTRSPFPELKKGKGKLEDHVKKPKRLETQSAPCNNVQKKGKIKEGWN